MSLLQQMQFLVQNKLITSYQKKKKACFKPLSIDNVLIRMINILIEDGLESIVKPNPIIFPLRHFYKHQLGITRTHFKFHKSKKQKVSTLPITQKIESKPLIVSYLPLTESELESVSEDEQLTTNRPCER